MKRYINLLILVPVISGILESCSKTTDYSSTGNSTYTAPVTSMKADINSAVFSSSTCATVMTSGTLHITGYSNSLDAPPYIQLGIANYASDSTGTFNIDGVNVTAQVDTTKFNAATARSGTITITTSNSSGITGTYNFVCTDGTTVTAGSFSGMVL